MPEPELIDVPATTTAVIAGVVPMSELRSFFDGSFGAIASAVGGQGVAITGPALALYHGPPTDTVDLEVGFPTDSPVEPDGDVRPGALPAGRVARLVHEGGYDQLGDSWGRLGAWIGEQGLTPGPVLWEVYVTEPTPDTDPATLRTELNWSVA